MSDRVVIVGAGHAGGSAAALLRHPNVVMVYDAGRNGDTYYIAMEYVEGTDLASMIREDLVAERIAIESYSEIIRYLGDNDPTSRRLMEDILANEEEHAEEMKTLLESIGEDEKKDDKKNERKAAS